MAQIIRLAPARAPARHHDSAAPVSSVPVLHRQHMAMAARDDGMMAALATRFDGPARNRVIRNERPDPERHEDRIGIVSLGGLLVMFAVMAFIGFLAACGRI